MQCFDWRLGVAAVVIASIAGTSAGEPVIGQPTSRGRAPSGAFCKELGRINAGIDDPGDMTPFDHLAKTLDLLIPVAPENLRADLVTMRDTFGGVGNASSTGQSVLPAFAALMNPSLIDVEHRIALGIDAECGIVLQDPAKWPKDTTHSAVPANADRPACPGWSNQTNAIFNNRFPFTIDTSGANYWGLNYKVDPGEWIDIAGEYPHSRYFSMLPNHMHTDNLRQLTNVHRKSRPTSLKGCIAIRRRLSVAGGMPAQSGPERRNERFRADGPDTASNDWR